MKNIALDLNSNTILFLEADCNYTRIHWSNRQSSIMAKTMKKFQDIPAFQHFIRISRNYLVNPLYVQQIQNEKQVFYVELTTGHRLRTARRRKELLVGHGLK